jgi:hypothetical protein
MPRKNKQPRKPRQVQPKPQQAEPRVHHLGTAANVPRIAYKLEAVGIETASPVIGGNQLGADDLTTGSPEIGAPAIQQSAPPAAKPKRKRRRQSSPTEQALVKLYPPDGKVPEHVSGKNLERKVNKELEKLGLVVSWDTINRVRKELLSR